MKNRLFRYCLPTLALTILLTACATQNPGNTSPALTGKWLPLGESASSNVQYALDKTSIKRQGNIVQFRDRKVIRNPQQHYYSNTPAYKTAVSVTQMDCSHKNFRILEVELFDQSGELLRQDHFSDTDLRPMGITNGSAAEQQYKAVCSAS